MNFVSIVNYFQPTKKGAIMILHVENSLRGYIENSAVKLEVPVHYFNISPKLDDIEELIHSFKPCDKVFARHTAYGWLERLFIKVTGAYTITRYFYNDADVGIEVMQSVIDKQLMAMNDIHATRVEVHYKNICTKINLSLSNTGTRKPLIFVIGSDTESCNVVEKLVKHGIVDEEKVIYVDDVAPSKKAPSRIGFVIGGRLDTMNGVVKSAHIADIPKGSLLYISGDLYKRLIVKTEFRGFDLSSIVPVKTTPLCITVDPIVINQYRYDNWSYGFDGKFIPEGVTNPREYQVARSVIRINDTHSYCVTSSNLDITKVRNECVLAFKDCGCGNYPFIEYHRYILVDTVISPRKTGILNDLVANLKSSGIKTTVVTSCHEKTFSADFNTYTSPNGTVTDIRSRCDIFVLTCRDPVLVPKNKLIVPCLPRVVVFIEKTETVKPDIPCEVRRKIENIYGESVIVNVLHFHGQEVVNTICNFSTFTSGDGVAYDIKHCFFVHHSDIKFPPDLEFNIFRVEKPKRVFQWKSNKEMECNKIVSLFEGIESGKLFVKYTDGVVVEFIPGCDSIHIQLDDLDDHKGICILFGLLMAGVIKSGDLAFSWNYYTAKVDFIRVMKNVMNEEYIIDALHAR